MIERLKSASLYQWIKCSVAVVLYILFCVWISNFWLLPGLFFVVDTYILKYIPWTFWKTSKYSWVRSTMEWVDALTFALVAVYFLNTFFLQNYQIPSSSLEKTLLVGDYLWVSKLSYGPRVPNTPLSFPLAQHTLPVFECKSYFDWPQWPYKRLVGTGHVKRNDIVVFNFPAGDTVALLQQNPDYHSLCFLYGRDQVNDNKRIYGDIVYRPVDRRENYVKRCVGLPGDTLSVVDNALFIDGVKQVDPEFMQLNYFVQTTGKQLTETDFRMLDVSADDRMLMNNEANAEQWFSYLGFEADAAGNFAPIYHFPLTAQGVEKMKAAGWMAKMVVEPDMSGGTTYPLGYYKNWTRDSYGPIWIPKAGSSVALTQETLPVYERCIVNYEGNTLEVRDGAYFINGEKSTSYTFKMDYYFMMGDNRHNSADSRSWGFVPEDHVVGQPIFVWLSIDKDRSLFDGKIRFDRFFKNVVQND